MTADPGINPVPGWMVAQQLASTVGGGLSLKVIPDLNTAPQGYCQFGSSANNLPQSNITAGILNTMTAIVSSNNNIQIQIAYSMRNDGYMVIYIRSNTGGNWSAWNNLHSTTSGT